MEIGFELSEAKIKSLSLYTDSLEEDLSLKVESILKGCPFSSAEMEKRLLALSSESATLQEIAAWLRSLDY